MSPNGKLMDMSYVEVIVLGQFLMHFDLPRISPRLSDSSLADKGLKHADFSITSSETAPFALRCAPRGIYTLASLGLTGMYPHFWNAFHLADLDILENVVKRQFLQLC
jgi:hypothetical protein